MTKLATKIAASTLALSLTLVACRSDSATARPSSVSAAQVDQQAARFSRDAYRALQQGRLGDALTAMEQAVELSPRDAGYRLTLADIYMKSGRFEAARTTFADVLEIDPTNVRAGLAYSLMQIALGRPQAAVAQLDELAGRASPADVGLAYALAGLPERAIEIMEPAARSFGASPRLRQNLALSYALAGNWERARIVAAQDLSPAELSPRLQQWAATAAPEAGPVRVARLLGVDPVADSGQPVRLALRAPEPTPAPAAEPPVEFADAAPFDPPAPEPAPADLPTVQFASAGALPSVAARSYWEPVEAAPEPEQAAHSADPLSVPLPAPERASTSEEREVRYAAAARTLVTPQPAVVRASAAEARAPRTFFEPAPRAAERPRTGGRFVVQLGAFSNQANAERAWLDAERRFGLSDRAPLTATIDMNGRTLHRVSVAGFGSQAEAQRLCGSIKARGGTCFVRASAGDASVRWAARYANGRNRDA